MLAMLLKFSSCDKRANLYMRKGNLNDLCFLCPTLLSLVSFSPDTPKMPERGILSHSSFMPCCFLDISKGTIFHTFKLSSLFIHHSSTNFFFVADVNSQDIHKLKTLSVLGQIGLVLPYSKFSGINIIMNISSVSRFPLSFPMNISGVVTLSRECWKLCYLVLRHNARELWS